MPTDEVLDFIPFWDKIAYIWVFMRVISKRTLRDYWKLHPECENELHIWYQETSKALWQSPHEIKSEYPKASILKSGRVVFNILGNKYRLVVEINYKRSWIFIRFIGNHLEYDKIDANKI